MDRSEDLTALLDIEKRKQFVDTSKNGILVLKDHIENKGGYEEYKRKLREFLYKHPWPEETCYIKFPNPPLDLDKDLKADTRYYA